jgi:predicted ATPase
MAGVARIRTPDQRLRVFVSSTLQELAPERGAVERAILRLHLTPVLFELGARPHPPRALYRAYLEQSQVFIGIYWQRYGWVAPGEEVSGLEDEYRLSARLPRLIYVKEPAPEREQALRVLLDRVRDEDTVSYRSFDRLRELARLVANDLAVLLSERYGAGDAPEPLRDPQTESIRMYEPLPDETKRLVGRRSDVARVTKLLTTPGVRLVTLTGPAGVGKTRLAVAAARRAAESFSDGAVWVPVESVTTAEGLIPAVANSLRIAQSEGASQSHAVASELALREMLLVLDNFEHMLDAGPVLVSLLHGAPGVRALVTSRAVLRLQEEHEIRVEPLRVDGGPNGTSSPAVELLTVAGTRARHGWSPQPHELNALAQIGRRLDGLPLALELAAAWLRILTPEEINGQLADHGLQLLVTGPRDVPERQRTLRGAVDWSYRLLSDEEQRVFSRLSVFVGGATVQAADDVCNRNNDLDLIAALRALDENNLIESSTSGTPRVRMLHVIRHYAMEKLTASGERDELEAQYDEHFMNFVASAAVGLNSPAQIAWLHRLDTEFDNILAVLERAGPTDRLSELLPTYRLLAGYLWLRDRYDEGLKIMERALVRPQSPTTAGTTWLRWWRVAFRFWSTGDVTSLATEIPFFVELARAEGDQVLLGHVLGSRAMPALISGNPQDASESLTEAVAQLDAAGDHLFAGLMKAGLARLRISSGDAEGATRALRDLIADAQERGNVIAEATATAILGFGLVRQGATTTARQTLLTAASLYLQIGKSKAQLALALHSLAAACAADGDESLAAQLLGLSMAIRPATGGLSFEHAALEGLLSPDVRQGEKYGPERAAGAATVPEDLLARLGT